MPFAASLGFHADEIESSNMDSLVQWKKAAQNSEHRSKVN